MEDAEARGRLTDLREQLYGAATRQMLEAGQISPGDRVLDIAAGTGDQSRMAARLVGPEGSVLATDISGEMLEVAARFAQLEGLNNIATQVMNAEHLDLPPDTYDAVISRFGLMLIPRQDRALAEIRRVLKPSGRLAALAAPRTILALRAGICTRPVVAPVKVQDRWLRRFPSQTASAMVRASCRSPLSAGAARHS